MSEWKLDVWRMYDAEDAAPIAWKGGSRKTDMALNENGAGKPR